MKYLFATQSNPPQTEKYWPNPTHGSTLPTYNSALAGSAYDVRYTNILSNLNGSWIVGFKTKPSWKKPVVKRRKILVLDCKNNFMDIMSVQETGKENYSLHAT